MCYIFIETRGFKAKKQSSHSQEGNLDVTFRWHLNLKDLCDLEGRTKVREKEVMQVAAASAILAPTDRNSQKGVMELLEAAAADGEGLQHRGRCCLKPRAYTRV